MADSVDTKPAAEKSWWETAIDTVTNLGKAGTQAYKDYTAGKLNSNLANQTSDTTKSTDWGKIAAIGGAVLLVVVVVAVALGGRRRG